MSKDKTPRHEGFAPGSKKIRDSAEKYPGTSESVNRGWTPKAEFDKHGDQSHKDH
jgi:hypothetical protein